MEAHQGLSQELRGEQQKLTDVVEDVWRSLGIFAGLKLMLWKTRVTRMSPRSWLRQMRTRAGQWGERITGREMMRNVPAWDVWRMELINRPKLMSVGRYRSWMQTSHWIVSLTGLNFLTLYEIIHILFVCLFVFVYSYVFVKCPHASIDRCVRHDTNGYKWSMSNQSLHWTSWGREDQKENGGSGSSKLHLLQLGCLDDSQFCDIQMWICTFIIIILYIFICLLMSLKYILWCSIL